jgi:predicted amidohydrolase
MMSRIIRIACTSMATLESGTPPYNRCDSNPAANFQLGLSLLQAAGAQKVDLVCLPEAFLAAGLAAGEFASVAEPIPGPTIMAVRECARRYSMNVVAGFIIQENGNKYNVAALVDRRGNLVGSYAKLHPTEGEIACGITPGQRTLVFDTDFGRVGLAICFDINWTAHWQELANQRADLVCWISAYDGGFPLQAYAWLYQYPIVTSVWPYHARIVDITGRVLTTTSQFGRLAVQEVDLGKRLFHTDGQIEPLLKIQTRYGRRVEVQAFTDEHFFTLACRDPDLSVEQIAREFGLVDMRQYLDRCTSAQEQARRP